MDLSKYTKDESEIGPVDPSDWYAYTTKISLIIIMQQHIEGMISRCRGDQRTEKPVESLVK